MKKAVLAALDEAGAQGMSADELAATLGVLKARVHSWFSGTGKRTPEVQKIGPGRWRIRR